jgi:tetratricopeptide (TPR) repeat protein
MFKPALLFSLLLGSAALAAQEPSFDSLRADGRWKQLRPRIEGWYHTKPQDPYALLWMSRLKLAFGDSQAALEFARKAVALKSMDPEFQTQQGVAARAVLEETDSVVKMLPYAKEWRKSLETALAVNPTSEEATESLFWFFQRAPSMGGGSKSKAKELAQRLTNIKPTAGLVLQAWVACDAKDFEGAKRLLDQAITTDPRGLDAYRLMVTLHLGQKPQALDAAAATCRKALAANPRAINASANLAAILAEQGKWGELEATLTQAKQHCPENLLPYFYVAYELLSEKQLDKVEPYLRTYLSQDPEGFAPGRARAHALLGQLFEKQGRRLEAIKAYEQAVSLRPTFASAKKELERLKKG